jgi:hypothetical protein
MSNFTDTILGGLDVAPTPEQIREQKAARLRLSSFEDVIGAGEEISWLPQTQDNTLPEETVDEPPTNTAFSVEQAAKKQILMAMLSAGIDELLKTK